MDGGVVFRKSGDACCGACGLEPGRDDGTAITRSAAAAPVRLETSRFSVFYRIVSGAIERVRVFSEECAIDAGGRSVHWIDDVKPASVALLMTVVPAPPSTETRRDRVVDGAITAIALHGDPAADAALDTLAAGRDRPDHIRKKAAFWMGQARGRRGFETCDGWSRMTQASRSGKAPSSPCRRAATRKPFRRSSNSPSGIQAQRFAAKRSSGSRRKRAARRPRPSPKQSKRTRRPMSRSARSSRSVSCRKRKACRC